MVKRSSIKISRSKQPDKVIGFRANQEDQEIIERLKKKLGIRADSEIIRQALRSLETKEKIT